MLMSSDLFLDCLVLLIHDNGDRNQKVVNELVTVFEQELKSLPNMDAELAQVYIRLIRSIIVDNVTTENPDQLRLILLKFKSDKILEKNQEVYRLLYEMFSADREQYPTEKLNAIMTRVHNALIWHRTNKITRTTFAKLAKCADMSDPIMQSKELTNILATANDLQQLRNSAGGAVTSGVVDRVNFNDKDSMLAAMEKRDIRRNKGAWKLGLQGVNRLFGKHGGPTRGESVCWAARSHNYKSSILMSTCTWVAMYNNPVSESGRRPLIILYSLENDSSENLYFMAEKVYYEVTGNIADTIPAPDLVAWMHEYFNTKGYALEIVRYLPDNFGFEDLVLSIAEYEAAGYEIHLVVIDYLSKMRKGSAKSMSNGIEHLHVRDLFNSSCQYLKTKGIGFHTGHQLNRRADELVSRNVTNVVRQYNNDHIADSSDVFREVDVVIYMEKELNHEKLPFLTMQLRKHRYVNDTPETHKYCAYKFEPKIGIPDDLNKPASYVTDIYTYALDTPSGDISTSSLF